MPPRLDPTLENQLVTKVKTQQDNEALTQLIHQHSGVYVNVVNQYAKAHPSVIRSDDLTDDRYLNIYRFVRDYDPERGTKLSTYIHYRTNYLCKTMLKVDCRKDPLWGAVGLSSGTPPDEANLNDVTLVDETEDVVENVDRELKLENILETARQVCTDERFFTILQYRHFNSSNNQMGLSWRQIGQLVGLSHEGCRKIYTENLKIVKQRLTQHA